MIAQPQSALRVSPAVSDFPRDSVPRLAVAAPPQSAQQVPHRPPLEGLLQVFTCVHRNYFTRVMAQAMRNAGQGTPTLIVQFLKGGCNQGPDQPMRFGQGLDWVRCRLEHCINSAPQTQDAIAAVTELWAFTREAIASGQYDSVVLDELSLAIAYGLVPEAEVMDCLRSRPSHIEVTLTGQKMPQSLLQMADQVTELRNIFNTVLPEPTAPVSPAVSTLSVTDRPAPDQPETPSTSELNPEPPRAPKATPLQDPVTQPSIPAEADQAETEIVTAQVSESADSEDPEVNPEANPEEIALMQLGLRIDGIETTTPHDLHLALPPVDELLAKYSEAHEQEIAKARALQAKANRRSKFAGKRQRRSSEQQISLPGFD